jgi:hypothetical protein
MSFASAESFIGYRGRKMKKTKATRGLWTWLLGGGWCGGGAGG